MPSSSGGILKDGKDSNEAQMTNQSQIEEALKWVRLVYPGPAEVIEAAYRALRAELERRCGELEDMIIAHSKMVRRAEKAEAEVLKMREDYETMMGDATQAYRNMTDERNEWEKRANEYSAELVALKAKPAPSNDEMKALREALFELGRDYKLVRSRLDETDSKFIGAAGLAKIRLLEENNRANAAEESRASLCAQFERAMKKAGLPVNTRKRVNAWLYPLAPVPPTPEAAPCAECGQPMLPRGAMRDKVKVQALGLIIPVTSKYIDGPSQVFVMFDEATEVSYLAHQLKKGKGNNMSICMNCGTEHSCSDLRKIYDEWRKDKTELAALRSAAQEDGLREYWSDTEARSSEAHDVYQKEAHRRGDVRHPDAYADLSEPTKEWDRVLVRWVQSTLTRFPKPAHQSKKEVK